MPRISWLGYHVLVHVHFICPWSLIRIVYYPGAVIWWDVKSRYLLSLQTHGAQLLILSSWSKWAVNQHPDVFVFWSTRLSTAPYMYMTSFEFLLQLSFISWLYNLTSYFSYASIVVSYTYSFIYKIARLSFTPSCVCFIPLAGNNCESVACLIEACEIPENVGPFWGFYQYERVTTLLRRKVHS